MVDSEGQSVSHLHSWICYPGYTIKPCADGRGDGRGLCGGCLPDASSPGIRATKENAQIIYGQQSYVKSSLGRCEEFGPEGTRYNDDGLIHLRAMTPEGEWREANYPYKYVWVLSLKHPGYSGQITMAGRELGLKCDPASDPRPFSRTGHTCGVGAASRDPQAARVGTPIGPSFVNRYEFATGMWINDQGHKYKNGNRVE